MPMPLAHGLLGATVAAAVLPREAPPPSRRRALLLGALLGICPDFDYLLNLIPGLGGGWHHGFTHSFAFALLAGLLAAALLRNQGRGLVAACVLAILSHVLLDFVLTESRGVELLWPLSRRRFRLQFPNPIDYSWRHTSLRATALDVAQICVWEFVLFAPPFAAVLVFKYLRRRRG
jgi:membrane-bound metal-dependent hydrolase YbcI (DUF457 family)